MTCGEYIDIPFFSRYGISNDGRVIDKNKQILIAPTCNKNGYKVVKLKNDRENWCSLQVAHLILTAFKPHENHEYAFATIVYRDNNKANVHLDNLIWSFKTYKPGIIPGINCTFDTFVPIYGHPNYCINAYGFITDRRGKIIKGSRDVNGYLLVSLCNLDESITRTSIHRLVALTFIEHPIDTTELIINHKDGNIENNYFKNLEWCSYTYNIDHAYDNSMRNQNIPVMALNIETKTIESFPSLHICCHKLKIPHRAIWWRLRNARDIKPYHGYYIKYIDDPRPLLETTNNSKPVIAILIKNIATGVVSRYNSYNKVMRELGIQKNSLFYQLNKPEPVPYHGVLIKYYDEKPWPEYSADDLQKYALKTTPQSRPISVHNIQLNETKYYGNVRDFCREIKCKAEMYLRNKIRDGEMYKHYEIKYL